MCLPSMYNIMVFNNDCHHLAIKDDGGNTAYHEIIGKSQRNLDTICIRHCICTKSSRSFTWFCFVLFYVPKIQSTIPVIH